jgi:hypothetical protein
MASDKKNADRVSIEVSAKDAPLLQGLLATKIKERNASEAKAIVKVLFGAVVDGKFKLADLQACFKDLSKDVLEVELDAIKSSELIPRGSKSESGEAISDETIKATLLTLPGAMTIEQIAKHLKRDLREVRYWVQKAVKWGVLVVNGKSGRSMLFVACKPNPSPAPTPTPE